MQGGLLVKNANKKPTIKQIAERVGRIETYLQKVINPNLSATMSMFEEYLDYKVYYASGRSGWATDNIDNI